MSENTSFENAFKHLKTNVDLIEKGDAPLDEMLKLYQQGMEQYALCMKILDEAEQRVNQVIGPQDTLE